MSMNKNVKMASLAMALMILSSACSDNDPRVRNLEAQGFKKIEFVPGSNEFEAYTLNGRQVHGTINKNATNISDGPVPHTDRFMGIGSLRSTL